MKKKKDIFTLTTGVNIVNEDGTETRYEKGDTITTDDVTAKQLAALFEMNAVEDLADVAED